MRTYPQHKKYQSGFSMVELLIAVALGILLSWAILDVTLTSTRTAREVELTSETVENGRYLSTPNPPSLMQRTGPTVQGG